MKKFYIAAIALASAAFANAQTEVLKIELNDGTFQTVPVDNIKEMTFVTEDEPSTIAGEYAGTNSVNVGGMYTYTAHLTATIEENSDGTINFRWPSYSLAGTVMGDLTLGAVTIPNIPYDESKGGYYLDYSQLGLQQHFTAVSGGQTTMDKDYDLGATSTILIEKSENGIKVTNPFKLGAMPFPITATFEGTK